MNLEQAAADFRRAIAHADNLVAVHRRAGTGARGRRVEEVSINRAVVVLTVATWQAVVQDLALACLTLSEPPAGDPFLPAYKVIAGRVNVEVGAFSTPNAENSRKLLQGVGFDPRPHWTWTQRGGGGLGPVTLRPADVDSKLNQWLRVRHALAHGHEHLPSVDVLQVVRTATGPVTDPALRLVDAEQCLAFFRRLVRGTGDALATHLSVAPPAWN